MSIGERIRIARKAKGLSQRHVATLFGITPGAVSQWESDETVPNVERLGALGQVLTVEIGWLVSGIGHGPDEPCEPTPGQPVRLVRVIGTVQDGEWVQADEWPRNQQFDIIVPIDPRFTGMTPAALRVQGPSITRLYPPGTFLVVVPALDLGDDYRFQRGDRVVLQRRGKSGTFETTVREFTGQHGADAVPPIHPSHDAAPAPESDDEDLRITGLVISSYRPERAMQQNA
jgi:transcriptional regulator with XRE-family HTH domain